MPGLFPFTVSIKRYPEDDPVFDNSNKKKLLVVIEGKKVDM